MAVLPPITRGAVTDLSNSSFTSPENESEPSVAINPSDPSNIAVVWVRYNAGRVGDNDANVEGKVTFNGGTSWFALTGLASVDFDPATSNPTRVFNRVTDASVAFDRNNNLYVLKNQHAPDYGSGNLELDKYANKGAGAPTATTVYAWNRSATNQSGAKAIYDPVIAVDDSVAYTDGSSIQTAPYSGNVYIAYMGDTPPPASPPSTYQRTTIELISSTDGGATFGAPLVLNQGGNFGDQRNAAPKLVVSQGRTGIQAGQVSVVWDDYGTFATANPALSAIRSRQVFNGGTTLGAQTQVALTTVRGAQDDGPYPNGAGVSGQGIGPSPSIASDNTLGAFSPYQGRLYVAYTGRSNILDNPADNTDIFLRYSDDGGVNWFSANSGATINDDLARADGFSESDPGQSGRPQYQPSVAVDPATGTVVVSYLDTRYDAARVRVATSITASIDGGASFNPSNFANTPQTAFDIVTRQTVTLGPLPDNQSSGNPTREGTYGFGGHQGLAVYGGVIYPAWSSNENGGDNSGGNNNANVDKLDIRIARMVTAAGPRVVSSTMGPVTASNGTLFNTFNSIGTRQVDGFVVNFDRAVDPNTFTTADVRVNYGNPYLPNDPPTSIAVNSVTALSSTSFLVRFAAQGSPGTYSYSVGPGINDRIRRFNGSTLISGNAMDQNANGTTADDDGILGNPNTYATPRSTTGDPFRAPYDTTTLPLIVPGPHVVLTKVPNARSATTDNLVLNQTVSTIDVVFDRDMMASSFTADDILSLIGPAGPIAINPNNIVVTANPAGTPANLAARTFRVSFPTQTLSGTYTLVLGADIRDAFNIPIDKDLNAGLDLLRGTLNPTTNFKVPISVSSTDVPKTLDPGTTVTSSLFFAQDFAIQDVTLSLNIQFANDPSLSAVLIAPDGTRIRLFTAVGAGGSRMNFTGTVFDDAAGTPIQFGQAPFFGRFKPQDSLRLLVQRNLASKGTYTLEITNASSTVSGTLSSWSLSLARSLPGSGIGDPSADRTPVSFRIFTMDPTNPQSSNTWTSVGPASIDSGSGTFSGAGRLSAIAIDPSDPSGNTVFVAGASGGVWKTTDFLTTSPIGPTYVPLTDFGPTMGTNIGGLATFGRNNDPNQTIIFASTGEGAEGSTGVGFLRSLDGGAHWTVLDSTSNADPAGRILPINSPGRDHIFVGTTSYEVLVDPRPTPNGQVIAYAAITSTNANQQGIWRSLDTGLTWQRMLAGDATDVVLDLNSGPINAVSNPTGNLRILYAALRGQGVFISQNQGQTWSQLAGGVGKPFLRDPTISPQTPVPVTNPPKDPNGNFGRISLAKPALTGDPLQDQLYQGWLYALVSTPGSALYGVFMTKDFGQNWTQVRLPNLPRVPTGNRPRAVPSNDIGLADYDIGGGISPQLEYDQAIVVDASNPNIIYVGGKKDDLGDSQVNLIRVDVTGISDPHAFYLDNDNPDGGQIRALTTDPVSLKNPDKGPDIFSLDPRTTPLLNLYQDPFNPFLNPPTLFSRYAQRFANSGSDAKWTYFSELEGADPSTGFGGANDIHRLLTLVDPLTGKTRLIVGNDHGIWTGVDRGDGQLLQSISQATVPTYSRNGNLAITQFYYGATQPTSVAAQIAGALFYGQAQDDGFPRSDPGLLANGNLRWFAPGGGRGDGTGVALPQVDDRFLPDGSANPNTTFGGAFDYKWPCCGGNITDFLQYNDIGRTFGLIQQSGSGNVPDPQWPFLAPGYPGDLIQGNFALNPINNDQLIISSNAGRIFATTNGGRFWLPLAEPGVVGGAYHPALAFGAPGPNDTTGSLNNLLYAGTVNGKVFVTFTGGGNGTGGNAWIDISAGLLDNTPVAQIITNPTRGSREAYAVTLTHVYYMADSAAGLPWQDVTGNLFRITQTPFGDPTLTQARLENLTSMLADWRYVIPEDPTVAGSPTHPILYAGGDGGVFRSLDNGTTWTPFPDQTINNAPRDMGNLTTARITDLDFALGSIDPTTGRPIVSTGPSILTASTYGRGSYAIRLAPLVFPNPADPNAARLLRVSPATDNGPSNSDGVTSKLNFIIDGFSEQSAFGNTVTITLLDLTDPTNPRVIPTVAGTNTTDALGQFHVQVAPGAFTLDKLRHVIGVQAVNAAGTTGNIATLNVTLKDTTVPPTPAAPRLLDASNSGSKTDNVTNVRQPYLTGSIARELNEPAARVRIIDASGNNLGESFVQQDGTYFVRFASPFAQDGSYPVRIVVIDDAGNMSLPSPTFTLQILTSVPNPTVLPTFTLLPADDSGTKGDNITRIRQPRFQGLTSPNLRVDLVDASGRISGTAGTVIASTNADAGGNFFVQVPAPLADGTYPLRVRASDVAGNSKQSGPVNLIIDTSPPNTVPTLNLLPADDTGLLGDGFTTRRIPRLAGTAEPNGVVEILNASGLVLAFAKADASGNFIAQYPTGLRNFSTTLLARSNDAAGNQGPTSPPFTLTVGSVLGDFDGDGKADVSVYRPGGGYFLLNSTTGFGTVNFGGPTDIPLRGDFDGDGRADYAVYRPSTGTWFILRSSSGLQQFNYGAPNVDIPVPADYDGDGLTDVAVYRPTTAEWLILPSTGGGRFAVFGSPGDDRPVPADYDGDRKADLAVYRSSTGAFYISQSTAGMRVVTNLGLQPGDVAAPANFNGLATDPAIYRPSTGQYLISRPNGSIQAVPFGASGFVAVPADYDGDGKADVAVFLPSNATWYLSQNTAGFRAVPFGAPNLDIPIQRSNDYNNRGIGTSQSAQSAGVPAARATARVATPYYASPGSSTILPLKSSTASPATEVAKAAGESLTTNVAPLASQVRVNTPLPKVEAPLPLKLLQSAPKPILPKGPLAAAWSNRLANLRRFT